MKRNYQYRQNPDKYPRDPGPTHPLLYVAATAAIIYLALQYYFTHAG